MILLITVVLVIMTARFLKEALACASGKQSAGKSLPGP